MNTHTLLITTPDRPGLVAKTTRVLFDMDMNVISNGEFVESESNRFFMRTEFQGELKNPAALLDHMRAILPEGAEVKMPESRKKRVVVLATKEPHCLGDILIQHRFGEMNCDVLEVISNHGHLGELAQAFKIPFTRISHEGLSREEHEARLLTRLDELNPDLIVMAKYMRVLSPEFIDRYPESVLNIHHSFLPAFAGANPYRQAFNRGVKIIGATAHFATRELDEGPIIAQNVIPVAHSHSVKDLARAGRDVEKSVLSRALRLVLEDRVFVHGNRTVIFE